MERIAIYLKTTAFIAATLLVFSAGSMAATFTVTKTADTQDFACDADCSLREAVLVANLTAGADTIVFSSLFNSAQTITLTLTGALGGDLDINGTNDTLTITGPGSHLLTIDQTVADERVVDIAAGETTTISGLTITGASGNDEGGGIRNDGTLTLTLAVVTGNSTTAGGGGGGIHIVDGGVATLISVRVNGNSSTGGDGGGIINLSTLTILDSLIDGNSTTGAANHGGGLYNTAAGDTITIANSTITNNSTITAGADGGGIYNNTGATLNLNNATISHNTAADDGGGVFDLATVNIRNTIVSDNTATTTANEDLAGSYTSDATAGGNNLIEVIGAATGFTNGVNGDQLGVDPGLGPLQQNFGPTLTRAITPTSPAYNTGNACVTDLSCAANDPPVALVNDQRGTAFPRNNGGAVDKGAYEFNLGPSAAGVSLSGRVMNDFGRGISRVAVTLTGGPLAEPIQTYTGSFGYYTFNDVPAGQSYIISVRAKQHVFANPTLVVTADDNISGLDFIAERVVFKSEK